MAKLYHLSYLICQYILLGFLYVVSSFWSKKKKDKHKQNIAAFPYLAEGYPGGDIRIANWKPHFEKEGLVFDVFWPCTDKEFLEELHGSTGQSYRFHFKILFRRVRQFLQLNQYDVVWVQRGFVPYFPFRAAHFERLIKQSGKKMVVDFYDADYEQNYDWVVGAARLADKVSVASAFLYDYFKKINNQSAHLYLTIDYTHYKVKTTYDCPEKIVIGWMGNPGNSQELLKIESQLQEIERNYPNVQYHFVCRKLAPVQLKNITVSKWGDEGFDYYEWLQSIDIGIVPYLNPDDTSKAKPAMKTLEFMASAIPFVASIWGSYETLKDGESYMLAKDDQWAEKLSEMIENKNLREQIGKKSREQFLRFHTYEENYAQLKQILLDD